MRSPGTFSIRALRTTAALAAGALVLFAAGAPSAQPQGGSGGTFQLAFCNISGFQTARVAITHRKDAQRWAVDGWFPIPDGGCSIIGTFQLDTVYYYAMASNPSNGNTVYWGAADDDKTATSQCIDEEKAFSTWAAVPNCPAQQSPKRFRALKVNPNTRTFTFTLSE
jgi:uncharacterized membrane protein